VLVSAEEHIRSVAGIVVERRVARVPEGLRKTLVFCGVRWSGKTFVPFDLFLRHPDQAPYVDFEDDRLAGFSLRDFDTLREAFFDLKPRRARGMPWFLLDEVQNVAGRKKFCRRAADRQRPGRAPLPLDSIGSESRASRAPSSPNGCDAAGS